MITDCKLKATFLLAMAAMCATAEPVVTDVVAKQRYPWNGLVDITCKVTGISGTDQWKFSVAAVMPDTGNARKVSQFWVVKNGVNSTDKKVQANGSYKLLWDAQAELGAVIHSNMVMRVTVVDLHDKVQLWEGGPYWADTNIGADEPYEYGCYFWWGDTIGYKRENDKWVASNGASSNFSFSSSNTPTYTSSTTLRKNDWTTADAVLAPEHDAAHVHWSGTWRMPTMEELLALSSKCTWSWTTINGVKGCRVNGKGDYASASIFLPAAGYGDGTSLYDVGSFGAYWSSCDDSYECYSSEGVDFYSWFLYFYNSYDSNYYPTTHYVSSYYRSYGDYRYCGRPVRPVQGFTE